MIKKKVVPSLRFKGFDDEWVGNKLQSLGEFTKGRHYSKNDLCAVGTPIILYGRLYTRYETIISKIDTFVMEKHDSLYSRGGEVLVPSSGETPEDIARASTVLMQGVLLGGDLNVMYPNKLLNSIFLALSISHGVLQKELSNKAQGKSVVHVRNADLQELNLFYPLYTEQTQIGEFFKNIDQLINVNQKKYDKLLNIKKALLEKMFPQQGETVPKLRFDGFSDAWETYKAKETCFISTGKSNTQDKVANGKYLFFVRSPVIERSNQYLYEEEAVLTVGDGVGTGKVFHYVNGKYDLHQRVYRMYNFFENIYGKFFYYNFSTQFYKRVMSMTAKTSVDSVRLNMIAEMEMLFPKDKTEQQRTSLIMDYYNNLLDLQQQKLNKLKNIKQACLEKMFV